jgi:hypothetical protein
MKKIVVISLVLLLFNNLVLAAESSSAISLPINQIGTNQGRNFSVPLDNLIKGAVYDITCSATNSSQEEIDIGLKVNPENNTSHGKFSLNGSELIYGQGKLTKGENTINVIVVANKPGSSIAINNLTQTIPFEINHCVAKPATNRLAKGVKMNTGFFTLSNNTDHIVVVSVGDFFPTDYLLSSYDYTLVVTSTSNQNIAIRAIY